MIKKLCMCLMILFLFSCSSSTYKLFVPAKVTSRLLDSQIRSPIPFKEVRVYRSAHQVRFPYDKIAFLFSNSSDYKSDRVRKALKKEAGNLGANAVIVDERVEEILAIFVYY